MEGSVKSNEQVHRKIQVCLQNLALRKLKRCTTCVKNDSLNSNVTIDAPNRENSNSKSFSLESNLSEFSASKERVDLLQDFRIEDLKLNIPSQCIESRTTKIKKYDGQKDNGYLNDTRMDTNMKILSRNGRFSLPILKIESSEDNDITKISKKEAVKEESLAIDGNHREDIQEKENEETGGTTKLISQDTSRRSNPIITEEQSTDSRDYLKRGSNVKHLMEYKKKIDESIEYIAERIGEEENFFDGSTGDWKCSEACLTSVENICDIISSRLIFQIEHNEKNKEISSYGKRHFHLNRKCLAKHDEYASSYLATSINENIKDNSFYQFIRHRCGSHQNMVDDLSCSQYEKLYGRWDIQKRILESISTRYEHRCCCICRAHGNSRISCGYKCIMTPSSQRVTFHLPSKEETM